MLNFGQYLKEQKVEAGLERVLLLVSKLLPEVARLLASGAEGYNDTNNIYGEKQLKLDVLSNNLIVEALQKSKDISSIASEELEEELHGGAMSAGAENSYSVAFDPLDGSSLVDVNLAVGSIFGFYKGAGFIGRKGSEQVVAMIVVYGPRLNFLISAGNGVSEFYFDEKRNDFILSKEKLVLVPEYKMFAPGNLRACSSEKWYVELLQYWVESGYTLRYSGGMVPDVNQVLRKGGGIFTYPGYKEQPLGKLRLLFECAPIAFLVEQAGGVAVTENGRVLDLKIEKLDQRTPIFLGSKKEVELVQSYFKKKV